MKPLNTLLLVAVTWSGAGLPALPAEPAAFPPISSVSGSPRLSGKFVWADLVTDNVDDARKFYGGLFGWTFRDLDGYVVASNDDRPLCGMFQRSRPADRPEARPRWFGYISVPNVERASQKVTQAGGQVLASPRTLRGRGEQAICTDAEGVLFGVIKSSSGDPPDFEADPGDWIWIQLLSHDARRAADFYRAVAGYKMATNAANDRLSDLVLVSEGYARATIRTIPPARRQVQPHWLPFVRVKSVPESVARAAQLGGTLLFEPEPGRFAGRLAVVADPRGAAVGLLEWSEQLRKGER